MSSIRMRALMVSVLVAGGLAGTSSATAAEADVVQCATVDGLKFCTEVGFTKESTTPSAPGCTGPWRPRTRHSRRGGLWILAT